MYINSKVLSACVHTYVCMHACIHLCTYMCLCVYISMHNYGCAYVILYEISLHCIELHETVQHHGPLDDFKQLYSCLSHEKPKSTDLGNHTLLFRYILSVRYNH